MNIPNSKKIAVIIPTKNEERGIGKVLKKLPNPVVSDVYVVDCSTDRTKKIAERMGAKVITGPGKGKGFDFKYFLRNNGGLKSDVYVMLDGDGSYDPKELGKIVDPILSGQADVVMGFRLNGTTKYIDEEAMSDMNKIGNRFLTLAARIIYRKSDLKDLCTGYWAFTREYLKKVQISAKGFDLEANLFSQAIKNKFRLKQVPISYGKRFGETKLKMRDGFWIFLRLLSDCF